METTLTRDILKKVRKLEVRTNRLVNDSLAGSYSSVFKGRGMNFDEVREYVPGDDIRSIDWNVTARTGVPHIKKFTEERELTLMLVIDVSGSGEFGSQTSSKREMMAELGSVLAFSAIKNNDKVGLILFTDFVELYIPPQKGRSHILRVIREILFFQPQRKQTDFLIPLDFLNRVTKRKCVTFFLSDFCFTDGFDHNTFQTKLHLTNRRHDLVAIQVTDPREFELPDVGWLTLEDSETGKQVEVNTSDPNIRLQYSELANQHRHKLDKMFKGCGIDSLDLNTCENYLPSLLSFFNARKRRMRR